MADKQNVEFTPNTHPRKEGKTLADYLAYLHWAPRSLASGALRAHAPQTIDRVLREGPRITNYNFDEDVYKGASNATLTAYAFTVGYIVAEHGAKGLLALAPLVVARASSSLYERHVRSSQKS